MTGLLIDANALKSFVTDRIPRQTAIVAELIESVLLPVIDPAGQDQN